jgi:YegS/Rv2252/BmrU family lipid kinase
MRKTGLILNPYSGKSIKGKIHLIEEALKKANLETVIYETQSEGHATEIARYLEEKKDIEFIIVSGGDGTINEVINGLVNFQKPLAIIPAGSANVLAHELGIKDCWDTIKSILSHNILDAHVGIIENAEKTRKFILMAGIGFDGEVVKNVSFKGNAFLKKLTFIKEGIKNIFLTDKSLIEIVSDKINITCNTAIVFKARRYGGGFVIAKDVSLEKPYFQVIMINKNLGFNLLKILFSIILDKSLPPDVLSYSMDMLEIKGEKAVQIDGEFFGYTPAKIFIFNKKLKLFSNRLFSL